MTVDESSSTYRSITSSLSLSVSLVINSNTRREESHWRGKYLKHYCHYSSLSALPSYPFILQLGILSIISASVFHKFLHSYSVTSRNRSENIVLLRSYIYWRNVTSLSNFFPMHKHSPQNWSIFHTLPCCLLLWPLCAFHIFLVYPMTTHKCRSVLKYSMFPFWSLYALLWNWNPCK